MSVTVRYGPIDKAAEDEIYKWSERIWEVAKKAEKQKQQGSFMTGLVYFLADNIAAFDSEGERAAALDAINAAVDEAVKFKGL